MAEDNTTAVIHYAENDFFVGTSPSGHALAIETDSKRGAAATPMELLLLALGSCTAVDVIGILKKKRERVTAYRVEVKGERREDFPRSYKRLQVHHIIKGHRLSREAVAKAIELSETKYCSVAASLRPTAEILSTFETIEAEATD